MARRSSGTGASLADGRVTAGTAGGRGRGGSPVQGSEVGSKKKKKRFTHLMFLHLHGTTLTLLPLHSTASSGCGATTTACGLAAASSPTSPPSCRGTSRSTRRPSAAPPTASSTSPRGRSAAGWVSYSPAPTTTLPPPTPPPSPRLAV